MKKLIYISFGNANTPGRGVTKKIDGQIGAFQRKGYASWFVSGFDDGIVVRNENGNEQCSQQKGKGVRRQICEWCIQHATDFQYAYIRFQFFDPLVHRMLKAFQKNGTRVVMEIPTYPYEDELRLQGAKGLPKLMCDRLYRVQCAALINRFACPLYDKPILGKKTIHIRNGIDTTVIRVRKPTSDPGCVRLLAVASMSRWHGFERLIEGLRVYISSGGTHKIRFNVVGEGGELQKYKDLVQQYHLEDCVVFWGRQSGAELERAYDESDIGISSLGMHRLNTEISNPLKTVEYLAKGMPVVCEDGEVSISRDSPYRLTVPFNDSSIDVQSILNFYERIYSGRSLDQVIIEIRRECEAKCSMDSAMQPVVDFYSETATCDET